MTARYEALLIDSSTGLGVGTMPFPAVLPKRLNDVGTFQLTLPMTHPMAADDVLNTRGFSQNSDRGLLILRNDTPIREYELTGAVGDEGQGNPNPSVTLSFAESSWWTRHRALEVDKTYDGVVSSNDVYAIWRDQGTYHTSKRSNGLTSGGSSINAALPRFTVAPTSGLAGVTKNLAYRGTDRRLWADVISDLVSDPAFGLDWRLDVAGTRAAPTRTLLCGSPSLGSNILGVELNEHNLYAFGKTLDRERAGSRAHVTGATYTDTEQNGTAVTNGDLLLDVVLSRSDLTDTTAVTQVAKDLRRKAQPWVSTYTATYIPDDAGGLPFNLCNVGDAVYINYRTTQSHFLHTGPGYARVIGIDITPPAGDSPELVALTFNIPLDLLGT